MSLMSAEGVGDITHWSQRFLEALRESKPDHEVHLFGINRTPGLPNFFIGSSSEKLVAEKPAVIKVTQKTADLFLAPVLGGGIRMLQEEMPMTVYYSVDDPPRRLEISFYDAICFDSPKHSIVLGLIVTDMELHEFLTTEDIAELLPLIRNHAMPLLETYTLGHLKERQDEEMESLLNLMRQSNPGISLENLSRNTFEGVLEETTYDGQFLQYAAQELRSPMLRAMETNEKLVELSNTSLGTPQLAELAQEVRKAVQEQDELLRTLTNLAMLSQTDVRPRRGAFPLQGLIREIYPTAVQLAGPRKIQLKLEENTRNIFIAGDQKTLVQMCERLIAFNMDYCVEGTLWIRTLDSSDVVEKGFVALEFEDSGSVPRELSPSTLLNSEHLVKSNHPRLRRGGGFLFKLLQLYLEKSGGSFKFCYGENDGFTVRLVLPLVSRMEMERIKAGEISP